MRLWKVELQKLADETGLTIRVRHYPPGTSKWNKIEHRLFCRITQNWRGRPLTDHATIIELIAATTTKTRLKVESALDTRVYEKGIKVTNAEMKRLDIRGDAFHPEWNYSVVPRKPKFVVFILARVLTAAHAAKIEPLDNLHDKSREMCLGKPFVNRGRRQEPPSRDRSPQNCSSKEPAALRESTLDSGAVADAILSPTGCQRGFPPVPKATRKDAPVPAA